MFDWFWCRKLGWSDLDRDRYAYLRRELFNTVGLGAIKEFVADTIHDQVGRKGSGETGGFHYRHIILNGADGSGKKTAASLIGNLTAVINATKDPSQFMPPTQKGYIHLESLDEVNPDLMAPKC
eukprot:SAG31_NODE_26615_length_439_cov_1.020588_1_plen_123_part_10